MYVLQVTFCDGKAGESRLTDRSAYDDWATYADCLLTDTDMNLRADGVAEDAHPTKVVLIWESDEDPKDRIAVAGVFLLCEHEAAVDRDRRARSKLLTA